MYGYFGKILSVNLTKGTSEIISFDESFARKFIGGNGFAAYYINKLVPPDAEADSPLNAVVIAAGPFTGTKFPGAGRGHLASISPLTGYFFDSNFGGDFADEFKKTGFDAIIITGRSESPVYISIISGKAQIKNAEHLWGKETGLSHREIISMEGDSFQTAVIGPAGENGVLYSSIICSGRRTSAAGRGGIGAVFGFKNLKGIAVQGSLKTAIANEELLNDTLKKILPELKIKAEALTKYGTPVLVNIVNSKGKLCTRNAQAEIFEKTELISGEYIEQNHKVKNRACRGCPVACGKIVSVSSGEFSGSVVKMPEFETIYSLGTMLDSGDLQSIYNLSNLCDELGMDTISFGVTLAFLMECSEKGLLEFRDPSEKLKFGHTENLPEAAKLASRKEGFTGNLLSMGSEKASKRIGMGSEKFLNSVKGLELPGHSARGLRHMGLGYAVSTRGGSHHDARPLYLATDPDTDPGFENQAELVAGMQNMTAMGDSLVICRFVQERVFGSMLNELYIPFFKMITGWDMDLNELEKAGERIYTLERLINNRRGCSRKNDTLPYRTMNDPIPGGPSKGMFISENDLNDLLDKYYRFKGWSKNGIVEDDKALELGITE